jgi:hypothetical protein
MLGMVSPEAQQKLNDLILNNGRNSVHDAAGLEGLVRAALADYPRDANLLAAAVHAGIPQAIVAGSTDGSFLAEKLQDEGFVASEAARSAVQGWAIALSAAISFAAPPVEPDLPEVEIYEPPLPAAQPEVVHVPTDKKASSARVMIIVGALSLVMILGATGYYFWNRSQHPTLPVARNTSIVDHGSAESSTGTTGEFVPGPPLTGTTSGDKPPKRATPPITGDTAGSPTADMDAYNDRLASWRSRMTEALQTFQSELSAASALSDQTAALDQTADAYSKIADSLALLNTELDALNPPLEVTTIHRKLSSNAHRLWQDLMDGAEAAKAHDAQKLQDINAQLGRDGDTGKAELDSLIDEAGFDVERFSSDGILVHKV